MTERLQHIITKETYEISKEESRTKHEARSNILFESEKNLKEPSHGVDLLGYEKV